MRAEAVYRFNPLLPPCGAGPIIFVLAVIMPASRIRGQTAG